MIDSELATNFIETLKSLFYKFLVGNSTNNFIDLLMKAKRVERGMKKGKIIDALIEVVNPKKSIALGKKREEEMLVMTTKACKPKNYKHTDSSYLLPQLTWLGYYPLLL